MTRRTLSVGDDTVSKEPALKGQVLQYNGDDPIRIILLTPPMAMHAPLQYALHLDHPHGSVTAETRTGSMGLLAEVQKTGSQQVGEWVSVLEQ